MTQSKDAKSASYSGASSTVAERVRALRAERGWSQEELAAKLREVGLLHFDRQIVANLEYKRRKYVSLEELLGFAYVLNVPPVLLFLPVGTTDEVEPLRGMRAHPARILSWVTGDEPAPAPNGAGVDVSSWRESALPLRLYRDLGRQEEKISSASSRVKAAEYVGRPEEIAKARQLYADALKDLCDLLRPFEAANVRPPALPAEWIDTARALGYGVPEIVTTVEDSNV